MNEADTELLKPQATMVEGTMKVLICVAGMPLAEPTVRFGGLMAGLIDSEVTVLTVIPGDDDREKAQAGLDQARALLPELPVSLAIRQGKPAREIIRHCRTEDYALVVLGERYVGRQTLFLSSVVHTVIDRSDAPVLVVKEERPAIQRVLIATGGRRVAEAVVQAGGCLARAAGARVTLLHVASPLPGMYTGLATMEEELAELLQTDTPIARNLRQEAALLDQLGLPAQLKLRHGVAAQEILVEAQQGNYDLIVVGNWHKEVWFRGPLAGNVARDVVNNARRPVLVVRRSSGLWPPGQPIGHES